MTLIYLMIPTTLVLVLIFVYLYFWAYKSKQFEDLDSPAQRILFDETEFENLKKIKISQQRNTDNE